jgi:hypothetical protein
VKVSRGAFARPKNVHNPTFRFIKYVVLLCAGAAVNAAAAFERQLQQMFEPLLALSTIIRYNPGYPVVNQTFDSVAAELLGHVS